MSHAPNNAACPPAADEVEQIRARHEQDVTFSNHLSLREVHHDRATLLRIVDQLRANVTALESISKDRAELFMQADKELAAARAERKEANRDALELAAKANNLLSKINYLESAHAAKDAEIERLRGALECIVGQTNDQFVDGVWREVNSTAMEALAKAFGVEE